MKAGHTPYQKPHWQPVEVRQISPNITDVQELVKEVNRTLKDGNENIRRHRDITPVESKVQEIQISSPATETPTVAGFDESVLHNSTLVIGDQVKRFNFIDTPTVKFKVEGKTVFGKQEADISAKVKAEEILTGTIFLERLPFAPGDMPTRYPLGIPTNKEYEDDNYRHKPPTFYGWMVYNIIEHNWGLNDPNDYDIQLVDTHSHTDLSAYSSVNIDANANFAARLSEHTMEVEHYGLDSNTIIVWGVFYCDMNKIPQPYLWNEDDFWAGLYQNLGFKTKDNWDTDEYQEFIDATEQIIATDLIFRYTLTKGE
jgi:hypothetical protein